MVFQDFSPARRQQKTFSVAMTTHTHSHSECNTRVKGRIFVVRWHHHIFPHRNELKEENIHICITNQLAFRAKPLNIHADSDSY